MTIAQLTELLGWASLMNIGYLIFASLLLASMRTTIIAMHSKMFDVPQDALPEIYFKFLANYKTISLIFCVFPYLALKIMGQ